jgi:hypothetical protein
LVFLSFSSTVFPLFLARSLLLLFLLICPPPYASGQW